MIGQSKGQLLLVMICDMGFDFGIIQSQLLDSSESQKELICFLYLHKCLLRYLIKTNIHTTDVIFV